MSDRRAKLVFYGGAGAVTGANFLLATGRSKILIDCGLEQGGEEAYARNREPFPYNPSDITSLVVTHAHLDHVGRIPKLIKDGFVGDIYSTKPTADLAALMFEDALSIMDFEQREHGVTPLYGRKDAEKALSLWRGREYHEKFAVSEEEIKQKVEGNYDRTTFYRSFKTLIEKNIIHKIVVDNQLVKYAITESSRVSQNHVHFYCNQCGMVECMPDAEINFPPLPAGYRQVETELIIKGYCNNCNLK